MILPPGPLPNHLFDNLNALLKELYSEYRFVILDPYTPDEEYAEELREKIELLEFIKSFYDPRTPEERALDEWYDEYYEDTRSLVL